MTETAPRALLLLLVFVFGVAIMTIEMLASRLMAPYFGGSIYTWGSIIGVFLVAMAAGYAVGGYASRAGWRLRSLGLLLVVASLLIAIVPLLHRPVCEGISDLDLGPRLGPLLATTLLMSPTVFVSAVVSPFVISLMARSEGSAGLGSGVVLAVSTVGSFVGVVGTSFYLIDLFRVSHIFYGLGATCLACSVAVAAVGGGTVSD